MQPFVYHNPVTLIFGKENEGTFIHEISSLGKKIRLIYDVSFRDNGFLQPLLDHMKKKGLNVQPIQGPAYPSLNFIRDEIELNSRENFDLILGVGGGVCMDLAKAVAFGAKHEADFLSCLTYEKVYDGRERLPIALISTVPCSGTEMDGAAQITMDETKEQFGLDGIYSNVSWLNPEYVLTLPNAILARSVMATFVHCGASFLGPDKSRIAEDFALMFMNNIKRNLKRIMAGEKNQELLSGLMITSAMHVNGLTSMGKTTDMSIYYLSSMVQNVSGLPYTRAITTLFPYWLRDIYSGQQVIKDFFAEVYGVDPGQPDSVILKEGLGKIKEMYEEFGVPLSCVEIREMELDEDLLHSCALQLGTIESRYGNLTPEMNEKTVRDTFYGNL